jgi:hypothetical protein
VVPANILSFICRNTLLLLTMTLHLVSLKNLHCLCSSTITAASKNTQPNHMNIPDVIHPIVVPANISSFNNSNTLMLNTTTLHSVSLRNIPCLCSMTITAAYNNTQPNHTNIPNVIHPVVLPANILSFKRSNILLLNTTTLHSVSLENIPRLCSSTITAAYNNTQPNHTNNFDVIHPVVVPANILSFNRSYTLLLNTMTLHSISLENIPCLCSSTITAAYNNTQPNHTNIPNVIHPVVVPANISSFNCSNTLLLYTMTLYLVSLKNIPCLCSSTITVASKNNQPNHTNIPDVILPIVVPANISSFNYSNTLMLNTTTLHSVSLENTPCLRSSFFLAAYNNTQPNPTNIPNVIHPVVAPPNILSFICSDNLLLNTMTLHSVSLENIPCLCSSTITAAYNNTQPNHTYIPNVIHPILVPAHILLFNPSITLLLNIRTLYSVTFFSMSAVSFPLHYITLF